MYNDFGSNPLVNRQSHHYVADLADQHPLIANARMEHLLRSHLKGAFERTCVSVRSQGNKAEPPAMYPPQSAMGTIRLWLSGYAPLAHRKKAQSSLS